jgi:hypothetical protein
MGSFPFASTICHKYTGRWWWRYAMPSSSLPPAGFLPPFIHASCSRTARCPDAGARPANIRGGVSRRPSGPTFTRSERGNRAMAERGPPSRPSC